MRRSVMFYDPATGIFTGRGYTGPDIEANTPEGLEAFEGEADPVAQRVDIATGELVDYQPPAPPDTETEAYSWDAAVKRWIAAPTLLAHQRAARLRINLRADSHLAAGMIRGGIRWDVDAAARAAMIEYVTAIRESGTVPAEIVWTDADDTDRTLTPTQFRSLVREAADFNQAVHARARQLKTAVMAAADAAGVQAVLADIETGWPT